MADVKLFDKTVSVLQRSLDLHSQKQQVIAANVANAQTPGYQAVRFQFRDALRQAVSGEGLEAVVSHPNHIPVTANAVETVRGSVTVDRSGPAIGDRNNVNVDQEMVALSENEILYETAVQLINKKLGAVKYVLTE